MPMISFFIGNLVWKESLLHLPLAGTHSATERTAIMTIPLNYESGPPEISATTIPVQCRVDYLAGVRSTSLRYSTQFGAGLDQQLQPQLEPARGVDLDILTICYVSQM